MGTFFRRRIHAKRCLLVLTHTRILRGIGVVSPP